MVYAVNKKCWKNTIGERIRLDKDFTGQGEGKTNKNTCTEGQACWIFFNASVTFLFSPLLSMSIGHIVDKTFRPKVSCFPGRSLKMSLVLELPNPLHHAALEQQRSKRTSGQVASRQRRSEVTP